MHTHADCIFTDWVGFRSPFAIHYQSVFHVRDTVLRNMRIDAEIADVSFEGIVHFQNVSLANVTLQHGAVVSTTINDYEHGFTADSYVTYYAEDDANYDVALEAVRPDERSLWGEEFVLGNATMSDCMFPLARPGTVYPGCPPESAAGRVRIEALSLHRTSGADVSTAAEVPAAATPAASPYQYARTPSAATFEEDCLDGDCVGEDYVKDVQVPAAASRSAQSDNDDYELQHDPSWWFADRFLDVDSPWLVELRQVRHRWNPG